MARDPTQDIWPNFIGEGFPTREPVLDTIVQLSSSGADEVRIGKYPYPRYKYTFEYQYLGDGYPATGLGIKPLAVNVDYDTFIAFYKFHAGRFYSFMLNDPDDNSNVAQNPGGEQIGTGDGQTKYFQLMRTKDGIQEPVYGINTSSPSDVTVTGGGAYTVNGFGLVTFSAAPAGGAAIMAVLNKFYWRVRFDDDNLAFQKLGQGIWGLKQVVMITTRQ